MSNPYTRREVADGTLARLRRSLAHALAGGNGNVAVIRQKIDDWLDYRHEAMDRLRRQARMPIDNVVQRVFVERREIGPWVVQETFDVSA